MNQQTTNSIILSLKGSAVFGIISFIALAVYHFPHTHCNLVYKASTGSLILTSIIWFLILLPYSVLLKEKWESTARKMVIVLPILLTLIIYLINNSNSNSMPELLYAYSSLGLPLSLGLLIITIKKFKIEQKEKSITNGSN